MKPSLIEVLCIVLTQFSIGVMLLTAVLSAREIRLGFFTLNSLLCAITAAIVWLLAHGLLAWAWNDARFLGLSVIGATAAFGCYRLGRAAAGRVLLIVSGLVGLPLGLLPLVNRSLAQQGVPVGVTWLFELGAVGGVLLLGATSVGMILGHWYLLMRRLSFQYLRLFTMILAGAILLRVLLFAFTLATLGTLDPKFAGMFLPQLWSVHAHLGFTLMRILWGLLVPAVLVVMVHRCVAVKANQAATGLLYVMMISVLFGELFAAYLLV
jgi:hypothetical protein